MANDVWWAVARSEEVTSKKPISVDIGSQPIVLWRDAAGVPRALEDRCPHRRAPLSLGCVLGNGMIQCGYHGWTYDGATGHLKDIPNLKSTQKFPPLYRATPFAAWEGCVAGQCQTEHLPVVRSGATLDTHQPPALKTNFALEWKCLQLRPQRLHRMHAAVERRRERGVRSRSALAIFVQILE